MDLTVVHRKDGKEEKKGKTLRDERRKVKNQLQPSHPLLCSHVPGESVATTHTWKTHAFLST